MFADLLVTVQLIEDWHIATALAIFYVVSLPLIGKIRSDRAQLTSRLLKAKKH